MPNGSFEKTPRTCLGRASRCCQLSKLRRTLPVPERRCQTLFPVSPPLPETDHGPMADRGNGPQQEWDIEDIIGHRIFWRNGRGNKTMIQSKDPNPDYGVWPIPALAVSSFRAPEDRFPYASHTSPLQPRTYDDMYPGSCWRLWPCR